MNKKITIKSLTPPRQAAIAGCRLLLHAALLLLADLRLERGGVAAERAVARVEQALAARGLALRVGGDPEGGRGN